MILDTTVFRRHHRRSLTNKLPTYLLTNDDGEFCTCLGITIKQQPACSAAVVGGSNGAISKQAGWHGSKYSRLGTALAIPTYLRVAFPSIEILKKTYLQLSEISLFGASIIYDRCARLSCIRMIQIGWARTCVLIRSSNLG